LDLAPRQTAEALPLVQKPELEPRTEREQSLMRRTVITASNTEPPDSGSNPYLLIERQERTEEGWETKVCAFATHIITRDQRSPHYSAAETLDGVEPPPFIFMNLHVFFRAPSEPQREP
jgi:hypothetical protein